MGGQLTAWLLRAVFYGIPRVLLLAALFVRVAVYLVRLIRNPSLRFDAHTRELRWKKDGETHRVPFSSIDAVSISYVDSPDHVGRHGRFDVRLRHQDQGSFHLASLSGRQATARERTLALVRKICRLTGATYTSNHPLEINDAQRW